MTEARAETEELLNVHPGEVIREEFLKPWGMSPYRLAKGLGITPSAVAEILQGRRAITPNVALRLSRFLGCSPRFWLNLQAIHDLRKAERELAPELERIQRYQPQAA